MTRILLDMRREEASWRVRIIAEPEGGGRLRRGRWLGDTRAMTRAQANSVALVVSSALKLLGVPVVVRWERRPPGPTVPQDAPGGRGP